MKLVLAGVGRLKAGPERDLFDRYVMRAKAIARAAGVTGVDVVEVDEGRARTPEERKREEAASLAAKLSLAAHLVVLDERGVAVTSEGFASSIRKTRDAGVPSFAIAIGGPDGFEDAFLRRAALSMAFGAATLPHQLVRVLAAEQVYRAFTILTGHPYHRA